MIIGKTPCKNCNTITDCGRQLIFVRVPNVPEMLFRSWGCLEQYAKLQGELVREQRAKERERMAARQK
jgi:hypothetical protein